MRLDALLPNDARLDDTLGALKIRGLSADSRTIDKGYLFAALSGSEMHGARFISDAVARGASVVLTDDETAKATRDIIATLADDNPRRTFAQIASRFFAYQPAYIACITGTNGKTSVAHFLRQMWQGCGYNAATIGTLGIEASIEASVEAAFSDTISHTTAEPVQLHSALRDLYAHQITHLALEASSHGLAQYRLDGISPQVAGFTNLSRDHLDYHKDEKTYLAAKARLFTEVLAQSGTAVVCTASEAGRTISDAAQKAGRNVLQVNGEKSALALTPLAALPQGLRARLTYEGESEEIVLPLIGAFQLENIALALGMALATGESFASLKKPLPQLKAARGRMQYVGSNEKGAAVYVDYAHTPDALENALAALRAHLEDKTGGKLYLVFGCGGNRDAGKRPQMGAIAARLADGVIITDDNPRHEDAASIRAAIGAAAPEAKEISPRADAIFAAIDGAQAHDIVLIAGKGHEREQIIGDTRHAFDVVREAARHTTGETTGETS